ncbi:hypothetical protein N431DRAFT_437775 [Stipitochalara longipes BDJ]|nr:hypothetical protein N431DRAFT_437775 [Stipitochalara longipes BDJ]
MDAASSAAGNLATATYENATAAATTAAAAASSVASSFSWLSIKEVFIMVLLYVWYMFLFLACGAIIIGGIYLAFLGVAVCLGLGVEHSPKMWESMKTWVAKKRGTAKTADVEAQNGSAEGAEAMKSNEPQKKVVGDGEEEEEAEAKPNPATGTV